MHRWNDISVGPVSFLASSGLEADLPGCTPVSHAVIALPFAGVYADLFRSKIWIGCRFGLQFEFAFGLPFGSKQIADLTEKVLEHSFPFQVTD